MTLLIASFIAGILTGLAPCILPILPIILAGTADDSKDRARPLIIIGSLSLSVIIFTLLLRTTTRVLNIPDSTLSLISGAIIIIVGLFTLMPTVWEKITVRMNIKSQKALGKHAQDKSRFGAVATGFALGPIFISCSPTYGLIINSVLPESFFKGFVNLSAYTLGLAIFLYAISTVGQKLVSKLNWATDPKGWFRKVMAIVFIIVGLAILTGYDKRAEVWLLQNFDAYQNILRFEDNLIEDER